MPEYMSWPLIKDGRPRTADRRKERVGRNLEELLGLPPLPPLIVETVGDALGNGAVPAGMLQGLERIDDGLIQ